MYNAENDFGNLSGFKLSIKVTIDIVTRTNIVFSIQNTIF